MTAALQCGWNSRRELCIPNPVGLNFIPNGIEDQIREKKIANATYKVEGKEKRELEKEGALQFARGLSFVVEFYWQKDH